MAANNVVSAAYKVVQPNRTQAYLRSALVADVITKAEFGNVGLAQEIKFPYMNSIKVQDYLYQDGNTRTGVTMFADSYTIDQAKTAETGYDRIQNLQIQNPSWVSEVEEEMGFQLAQNVDQQVIQKGVTEAYTQLTAGAITPSGLLSLMANTAARLTEARRMAGMLVWVMDPRTAAMLPQMNQSGFARADDALVSGMNGYEGNQSVGFKILISNNLKYTVVLSMPTNPSAGETMTIGGLLITFVAAGTANDPGEVSLGATAALTQDKVEDLINASGTPGASTYIDFDEDDRIDADNAQLEITAFTANDATITKYGVINGSTTSVATFGVETSDMLALVAGAIDMTMLQTPLYEELPANVDAGKVTHAKDMIMTTLWGCGVWHRRARSIAAVNFNVPTDLF